MSEPAQTLLEVEEMKDRHRIELNKYREQIHDLYLRIASLERHVDQLLRIIRGLVSLTLAITGRKD